MFFGSKKKCENMESDTNNNFVSFDDVSLEIPLRVSNNDLRSEFLESMVGGKQENLSNGSGKKIIALSHVNLHLVTGDRIAILGHNGAGKSTFLRVASGIISPTSGLVSSFGKISTLIDTSAGLNVDDTGLTNIISCGLFLGFSRAQMEEKTGDIIEFSELGSYINLPVKSYSSGMLARLTFSIATAISPEILILDEGFGAADASFHAKVTNRTRDLVEKANIFIFASHNKAFHLECCTKGLLLERGEVKFFGEVDEAWSIYEKSI